MFCTKCGKENIDGTKFCVGCGSPLGAPAAPVAPVEAPAPVAPVAPVVAPASAPQEPKKKTGLIIGIVAAVVAVIAIVIGVLFATGIFGGDKDKDDKDDKKEKTTVEETTETTPETTEARLDGIEGCWKADKTYGHEWYGVEYNVTYTADVEFKGGKVYVTTTEEADVTKEDFISGATYYIENNYSAEDIEYLLYDYDCDTLEEYLENEYDNHLSSYTEELEFYYYFDEENERLYLWDEGETKQDAIDNDWYSDAELVEAVDDADDVLCLGDERYHRS